MKIRVVFRGPFKSLERDVQPGSEIEIPADGPRVWKILFPDQLPRVDPIKRVLEVAA